MFLLSCSVMAQQNVPVPVSLNRVGDYLVRHKDFITEAMTVI